MQSFLAYTHPKKGGKGGGDIFFGTCHVFFWGGIFAAFSAFSISFFFVFSFFQIFFPTSLLSFSNRLPIGCYKATGLVFFFFGLPRHSEEGQFKAHREVVGVIPVSSDRIPSPRSFGPDIYPP